MRLMLVGYVEHIGVVSQQPNLFDASIVENIRFGGVVSSTSMRLRMWIFGKLRNLRMFIRLLWDYYKGMIREWMISGGQTQRLQIARALARPWTKIMILDECTRSLDAENQAIVLYTIMRLTLFGGDSMDEVDRKTTLMKLEVMQMCDRILVVDQREIVEDGSFEQLMEMKGVFSGMAHGGEWIGE